MKTRSNMPTCLQEMIHGVNIVQENGSSSGSTSITGLYRFIFNINYITSQPGHKVINHVHVPDVYKVNRLCVKPKQIIQQTDILIAWNQMDYLVIMKINAFQSYLTSWSYIIKYTHNVVSNYGRLSNYQTKCY